MKRSQSLSLILMGTLALASAGCGSESADETFNAFTSVNECVTSGLFSEAECKEFASTAVQQTPRFTSKEDCEAQFGAGACEGGAGGAGAGNQVASTNGTTTIIRENTGSSWMPMMMGFMAGRFLSGGGFMQGSQGLYRQPGADASGGARNFRTAAGESVSADSKGKVANPSQNIKRSVSHNAKPVMNRAGTGSRSGFAGGAGGGS